MMYMTGVLSRVRSRWTPVVIWGNTGLIYPLTELLLLFSWSHVEHFFGRIPPVLVLGIYTEIMESQATSTKDWYLGK